MDDRDQIIEILKQKIAARNKEIARLTELAKKEDSMWQFVSREERMALRDAPILHNMELLDDILADNNKMCVMTGMDNKVFAYILELFKATIIQDDHCSKFLDWSMTKNKMYARHVLLLCLLYEWNGVPLETTSVFFTVKPHVLGKYVLQMQKKLADILPTADEMSRQICKAESKEQIRELIPGDNGGTIIVEGFSMEAQRSLEHESQTRTKSEQFSLDTILYANADMIILGIWTAVQKGTHDKSEYRMQSPEFGRWKKSILNSATLPADKISIDADEEFVGIQDDYPGADVLAPHKKSKCARLTKKERNDDDGDYLDIIKIKNPVCKVRQYGRLCSPYEIILDDYDNDGYKVVQTYRENLNMVTGLANLCTAWDDILADRGIIAQIMKEKRKELGL